MSKAQIMDACLNMDWGTVLMPHFPHEIEALGGGHMHDIDRTIGLFAKKTHPEDILCFEKSR